MQPQINGNHWDYLTQQKRNHQKSLRPQNQLNTREENEQKLEKLIESNNQFCFSISTHLPFDLFPDDLIIDIHKVTFIDKRLLSKDAISIPIIDLNKVEVTNDLLFASMEIVNGSQTTTIHVNWLKKDEARQAQAILQGLMIAYKNDLHLELCSNEEMLEKLESLGTPVV